jgi:hypothetical protein
MYVCVCECVCECCHVCNVCVSVCVSAVIDRPCLAVCLSICLSVCLSALCLSVCLLSIYLFVCLSSCVPVFLYVSHSASFCVSIFMSSSLCNNSADPHPSLLCGRCLRMRALPTSTTCMCLKCVAKQVVCLIAWCFPCATLLLSRCCVLPAPSLCCALPTGIAWKASPCKPAGGK